jgi:hypothetical protein
MRESNSLTVSGWSPPRLLSFHSTGKGAGGAQGVVGCSGVGRVGAVVAGAGVETGTGMVFSGFTRGGMVKREADLKQLQR